MLNTLTTIRTQAPGLANDKIDSNLLLRVLGYSMENSVLYRLGFKQDVKRNAGTNKIQWRRYKPLPVANDRHVITEGVNPNGMKIGAMTVDGTVGVYGAYIEFTRQSELYNLDSIKEEYTPILADHAAETLELITRDAIEEDAGVRFIGGENVDAVTATDILTVDECRKAANAMKVSRRKGHESKSGKKYLVVTSTEGMQDLLDDDAVLQRYMIPGNTNSPVTANGLETVDIYNLSFIEYMYPVIENNASGVAVHHTYVIGERAYAVMKLASAGIEMKSFDFGAKRGDNLGQIASIGWITMGYGAAVLDPLAVTTIYHAVSNPLTRDEEIYASQE